MNNEDLKAIAEKVISKVPNQEPEKFGSVVLILMVISIILTLIRVLQECNKSKIKALNRKEKYAFFGSNIKEVCDRQSWFTRMTIKKMIRKELSKEDYQKYGGPLMLSILATGVNLTDDEIKTLVEAANV